MKGIAFTILLSLSVFACTTSYHSSEPPAPPESAVAWNELVLGIAEAEDGFLTLKGLHTTTMIHLAMHDALSNINGAYAPYIYNSPAPGAHPIAAVVQAGYTVALDLYPDQKAVFERKREELLAGIPEDDPMQLGRELGAAAANAILQARRNDGWDRDAEYQWHPMGPGVYAEFNEHSGTPEGFVFGAGWGEAKPFGLDRNDQFVTLPPPEINSAAYTEAYDEVREIGRLESNTRTADQTHIALWWKDFAENSHNRLARTLIVKEQLGLAEAVRLLALVNMSIYDAYVSSFYNKFLYNHWRPYTAIRWAEHDGNPDTEPETDWNNTHGHTYAFPSYPSAHGTACAAAMTAMADTFGDDYTFTMRTEKVDIAGPFSGKMEMDPPTRSFENFAEAAMECAMSRVYLGIHFRYDSIEGNTLGLQIGEYMLENKLLRRSK